MSKAAIGGLSVGLVAFGSVLTALVAIFLRHRRRSAEGLPPITAVVWVILTPS